MKTSHKQLNLMLAISCSDEAWGRYRSTYINSSFASAAAHNAVHASASVAATFAYVNTTNVVNAASYACVSAAHASTHATDKKLSPQSQAVVRDMCLLRFAVRDWIRMD